MSSHTTDASQGCPCCPGETGHGIDRREFLATGAKTAAAVAAASLLPVGGFGATTLGAPSVATAAPPPGVKTKRVILIAFAGGVRGKELIGTPDNIPNIMKIAQAGVVVPRCRTANLGHYGAALSIFTGVQDARGIRDNYRGPRPTMFEYFRKQLRLPAKEVWLSTTGGAQTRNFSYGTDPAYGEAYGANLISGDGLFNADFRDLLNNLGRPRLPGDKEQQLLDKLRDKIDVTNLEKRTDKGFSADEETQRKVERFILEELSGNTTRLTGPGAGDAKTIRIAKTILGIFRPTVLGITLQNHDVAHGSFNSYVEVVRRNDAEVGTLWETIQADDELKETTAIVMMPEFGRDADLNERQGLDHGDGSKDLREVPCIMAGPDFKKGYVLPKTIPTTAFMPTLCALFGVNPEHAEQKAVKEVFG